MSEDSIKQDLERHPDLSPILDTDRNGNVVCIGWISPIFTWEDLGPEEPDWLRTGTDEKEANR